MRRTIPPHPVPTPFPFPFPYPTVDPGPRAPLQAPMVYVAPMWEYRHIHRPVGGEAPPISEDELNALGADGWELTAVIPGPTGAHFYFKRAPE
jgi:hypothetical protein